MGHTRTRLVRIGNSRGIRIPKDMIERLNLNEEVEIEEKEGHLEVRRGRKPREGWEEAFKEMARRGDDRLIDESAPTTFDQEEWEW